MSLSKVEEEEVVGFAFPQRLLKSMPPVVESTCGWLSAGYGRLKASSRVTAATCSLAEDTLRHGLARLRPQADALDALACAQLARLEAAVSATASPPRRLASKLLELTEALIERSLLLVNKDQADDAAEAAAAASAHMRCYLDYKRQRDEMTLATRGRTLSFVLYCCAHERLVRQLTDAVEQAKRGFASLQRLVHMYLELKRQVAFKLHDQFHVTKDKIDLYKEYLDVLGKQFVVQDGRSLESVPSLEERTKIIIRRSIGNLLAAFHIVYARLQQLKPVVAHTRLSGLVATLCADIYQILNKDEAPLSEIVMRGFVGELGELTGRLDGALHALKSYNAAALAWCESKLVLNLENFGIVDLDDSSVGDDGPAATAANATSQWSDESCNQSSDSNNNFKLS